MSNLILDKFDKNKINKNTVPIWLMRQAGRYLPEYKKIRSKNKDFINFCLNIKDSSEVTLQPIERFNFDAAIIFSDILLINYAAGQDVKFKENFGPVLQKLDNETFLKLKEVILLINFLIVTNQSLTYVIYYTKTKHLLDLQDHHGHCWYML